MSASDRLLVVIDPVARRSDGESVRIAKDVLSARAVTKLCLPENPVEFARALARRGARHLVVVGDDRALLRAVTLLHREREPETCALSLVPVGTAVSLAHSLGVPAGAVAAARAVLQGVVRRRDLLVDDGGGVVLGGLRIPPVGVEEPGADAGDPEPAVPAVTARSDDHPDGEPVGHPGDDGLGASGPDGAARGSGGALRRGQSLVRTLAGRRGLTAGQARVPRRRTADVPAPGPARLRVEADGVQLVDVDRPVDAIRVAPCAGGLARIEIHPANGPAADPAWVQATARSVTVSGADFHYRADTVVVGPVGVRTWTVREEAWGLTVPG